MGMSAVLPDSAWDRMLQGAFPRPGNE
jgi:hypothetical protein